MAKAPPSTTTPTLKDVVDRVLANTSLSETRKRDLRSAVTVYGKVIGQPLMAVPLDLAAIRAKLDGTPPVAAGVGAKRWANLRSDLAAAITASGLLKMLKTADVELGASWVRLLRDKPRAIVFSLSRFARWATLRGIEPVGVTEEVMGRYHAELDQHSLVRKLRDHRRNVTMNWNKLAGIAKELSPVVVPSYAPVSRRIAWDSLPASFRRDVERYLDWCRVPDPLDENARVRALAPETLKLRRDHIHLAVTAALASGAGTKKLTKLARLVEPEVYKSLLRQRWEEAGGRFNEVTKDIAITLLVIAGEWVKVPRKQLVRLKETRGKLGGGPRRGFTDKNRNLLRRFDDPALLLQLVRLPDKLWRAAMREKSKTSFVHLQTALAIDILLHVAPRIKNLGQLRFEEHLRWPAGRGRPALLVFGGDETKNNDPLEFELPTTLANRLYDFRHEIAPSVIGKVPEILFVSRKGTPRAIATLRVAIEKAVLRHVGIHMSPHQFRHLGGKIALDDNPGAYEHVSQLLGHRDRKTAPRFYAGPNTRRAGRAHAALIARLRDSTPERPRGER
jgi:integrase